VVLRFDANPWPAERVDILSTDNGFFPQVFSLPNSTTFATGYVSEVYINGGLINRISNPFPEINQPCILRIVTAVRQQTYVSLVFRGWRGLFSRIIAFDDPLSVTNRNGVLAFLSSQSGIPLDPS
jgi:hypothetical protein